MMDHDCYVYNTAQLVGGTQRLGGVLEDAKTGVSLTRCEQLKIHTCSRNLADVDWTTRDFLQVRLCAEHSQNCRGLAYGPLGRCKHLRVWQTLTREIEPSEWARPTAPSM